MATDRTKLAREGCICGADSSVSDVGFHTAILDNPEAERLTMLRCRERALTQGMSQADVDKYLPID
jgi:hypothetical protein